jgi:hypothetical protein
MHPLFNADDTLARLVLSGKHTAVEIYPGRIRNSFNPFRCPHL